MPFNMGSTQHEVSPKARSAAPTQGEFLSLLLTHFPTRLVRSSAGCRAPGLVVYHWGTPGRVVISVNLS